MTVLMRRVVLAGLLVGAMFADNSADAYTWHVHNVPPSYLPATGHYYQVWDAQISDGEVFSWADASQFAASLTYQGLPGYLATINTEAEAQMQSDYNEIRGARLTGALLTAGDWKWATGPEAGQPVVFLRNSGYAVSQCAAYAQTISSSGGFWYLTPYSAVYNSFAGPPSSCVIPSILVEFGPLPPVPSRQSTWGTLKSIYR